MEIPARLPTQERRAWTLSQEGGSPEQIADVLGITRNNVDQILHRGRRRARA